jgi:hypothetical protein
MRTRRAAQLGVALLFLRSHVQARARATAVSFDRCSQFPADRLGRRKNGELFDQARRGRCSGTAIDFDQTLDDLSQSSGHARRDLFERRSISAKDLLHRLDIVRSIEGPASGHRFEEHDSQRKKIAPSIDRFAAHVFR